MSTPNPELGQRAYELFLQALEQPSASRTAFLRTHTRNDSTLFEEVRSLFASHTEATDFLASSALPVGAGHPDFIGPYRILKLLGEGGMGMVYLAEQQQPVRRQVALKIVKLGMDTRRVQARFQMERQALAMMNHPGIAKVFDVGTTSRGQAYFAMEYVEGLPITEFCDNNNLSLKQRVVLMQAVCHAVQHAHQKGILHRDIKPSNVLVTMEDGDARPHVIDFGVARALRDDDDDPHTATEGGAVIGTPDYMSPEQAGVGVVDVDTRTDVYSLGIVLYELIAGDRPYRFGSQQTPAFLDAQRRLGIAAAPPPRPSWKGGALPPDLAWIILNAIELDRTQRYATPNELADDLQRFVRHEPVHVGPPARWYLFRKFVERNRTMVVAGALILASLVFGLGTSFFMWHRSENARNRVESVLGNYRSVADDFQLRELHESAALLWPAWPERIAEMQEWMVQARGLLGRLPQHQQSLAENSNFDAEEQQWLERRRTRLLEDLAKLDSAGGVQASIPAMQARLDLTERLAQVTLKEHSEAWQHAIAAITDIQQSPFYQGLQMQPQIGLIPLEPDPRSGFWEFLVWGSGEAPTRNSSGFWQMTPDVGIILVLLPGGTAVMGAEQEHDPAACKLEGPRHEVDVQPFFLAKYELSIGQWQRLEQVARPPGPAVQVIGESLVQEQQPSMSDARLPQVDKSWVEMRERLAWLGLEIPTEAQWEYGARGGTFEPWICAPGLLYQYANLRDQSSAFVARTHSQEFEDFDDGFARTAPIGSFLPNNFGLHDVHGNVYEWCKEPLAIYQAPFGPANLTGPLLDSNPSDVDRVVRGGSFETMSFGSRLSLRVGQQTRRRSPAAGVRPARRISQ